MTRAEDVREITNKVQAQKELERKKQYDNYVEKLINGKIKLVALLGRSSVTIKIKKQFSQSVVAQHFIDRGFETKLASKNGKHYITVKW